MLNHLTYSLIICSRFSQAPLEKLQFSPETLTCLLNSFFIFRFAKLTNWFTYSKDFGQNLSILPKIPHILNFGTYQTGH